jgi:hypothetical protein
MSLSPHLKYFKAPHKPHLQSEIRRYRVPSGRIVIRVAEGAVFHSSVPKRLLKYFEARSNRGDSKISASGF